MKLAVRLTLAISILLNCSCASLRDYKASHNQFLDNTIHKLNEAETKEQVETGYFLVVPNPYETGLQIDSLGTSAFDYMQCKIDKFNARYPASNFGKHQRRAICNDEGSDK